MWKFYVDGQLSRIRRNTHCPNGKPDTWEIYYKNRLERVGNDATCDGHVDRWDRDAQLMAAEEAAQDKAAARRRPTTAAAAQLASDDVGATARSRRRSAGEEGNATVQVTRDADR